MSERTSKGSLYLLRVLLILLITVTFFSVKELRATGTVYDDLSTTLSSQPIIAKKIQLGSKQLTIPTYEMFNTGHIWALVSKKKPLGKEAGYTLIDIPVAHGDADLPMKVASNISDELQRLVNAAEADGEPLMISSAYRSLEEQQKIYDNFVKKNGKELAGVYVLPVGASEHHTGLSIDFSSVSDDCADDSDTCSLSQTAAAWLATNASRFGFIQRYPEGAQEVTGVGYEPWHYRFVGIPLAKAMASTDLTYEEVLSQIAPGYSQD